MSIMTYKITLFSLLFLFIGLMAHSEQLQNESPEVQALIEQAKADRSFKTCLQIYGFVMPFIADQLFKKVGITDSKALVASTAVLDMASHVALERCFNKSQTTSSLVKNGATYASEGVAKAAIDGCVDNLYDKYAPATKFYGLLDILKGRFYMTATQINFNYGNDFNSELKRTLLADLKLLRMAPRLNAPSQLNNGYKDLKREAIDPSNLRGIVQTLKTLEGQHPSVEHIARTQKAAQVLLQSVQGKGVEFLVAFKVASKLGLSFVTNEALQKLTR